MPLRPKLLVPVVAFVVACSAAAAGALMVSAASDGDVTLSTGTTRALPRWTDEPSDVTTPTEAPTTTAPPETAPPATEAPTTTPPSTAKLAQTPAPAPAAAAAPAPAPAPPAAAPQASLASAVYARVNADRAANGLPALAWHDGLAGAAARWAAQLAAQGSLTHQDMNALLASQGLRMVAENIYMGPADASSIESAFMNSAPHRANILNGSLTLVGIAVVVDGAGRAWAVQDFGA